MTTRFKDLLRLLADAQVEFILVGGAAAIAHGSTRVTRAAGRPKDFEAVAELEIIAEERRRQE